jgi:hypothetical protein
MAHNFMVFWVIAQCSVVIGYGTTQKLTDYILIAVKTLYVTIMAQSEETHIMERKLYIKEIILEYMEHCLHRASVSVVAPH